MREKAKRLLKAVKRLKGCFHLVTAFWPKIIPLSAKAIWAMPKYLRVNCNGASLSYGLLSAINQLAEMVCILSSGEK